MDSKGKDLNLMHVNIRGLRRNIEELVFTVEEKKIDIASINEMFLRPKYKITIPNNQERLFYRSRRGCGPNS